MKHRHVDVGVIHDEGDEYPVSEDYYKLVMLSKDQDPLLLVDAGIEVTNFTGTSLSHTAVAVSGHRIYVLVCEPSQGYMRPPLPTSSLLRTFE